jgi:hypothetical protein
MEFIFSKKQLKLNEFATGGNSGKDETPVAVTNPGDKNNSSQFLQSFSNANQHNSDGSDLLIHSGDFGGKEQNGNNQSSNREMVVQNGPGAGPEIKQMIDRGKNDPNAAPVIRVQNVNSGLERSGKLVEVTTFKKKELDKFLKSL